MATRTYSSSDEVWGKVLKLLKVLTVQLPMLQHEVYTVRNNLKENNPVNFSNICAAIGGLPEVNAKNMRETAEAANSEHFFTRLQTLKDVSHKLHQLTDEVKHIRRDLDYHAMNTTTAPVQQQQIHGLSIHLDEIQNLLYALTLELHELQLVANALYVHGLPYDIGQLHEPEGLKDDIARLVALLAAKYLQSSSMASVQ